MQNLHDNACQITQGTNPLIALCGIFRTISLTDSSCKEIELNIRYFYIPILVLLIQALLRYIHKK